MESYEQTLEYLYKTLPMFQRVGAVAYKNDLTNTIALCEALGNPERRFKSIHIAGTNGKGSSSHMLAAILQAAGYQTGLYTSPHLKEFTERIRLNGAEVPRSFVVDFVNRVKPLLERIQPSFFETTVAMAFDWFAQQQVDIAVIEVGLGGRLDSTNVILPEVSLITNISWDHMDLLGDTLPKIAKEKAGIIKPGVPVVISERQMEIDVVFEETARQQQSPIEFAADQWSVTRDEAGRFIASKNGSQTVVELELMGDYQQKNLPGVLATVERLRSLGYNVSDEARRDGLRHTISLTGLKGRWQMLGKNPLIVCDTGHNEAGVREVLQQIRKQSYRRLHIVWGMVKDKDPFRVLRLLPTEATYYFCAANIPRAMAADQLQQQAVQVGLTGQVVSDVNEAVATARRNASPEDMIFIGGSTFVVAEVNEL